MYESVFAEKPLKRQWEEIVSIFHPTVPMGKKQGGFYKRQRLEAKGVVSIREIGNGNNGWYDKKEETIMKYAFLLMGDYKSEQDWAEMKEGQVRMIGVSSLEEAEAVAKKLAVEGVACIELCGAFKEEGARRVMAATEGKVAVGFVTHFPEQDELFFSLFGN